jgi:exodeoxyribonuclease-3
MRILTLNLNGIRSATAKGVVPWLAASGADVVCLQEVRAFPEQAPPEWRDLGYHAEWCPAERPGYSGVALLSKTRPKRVTRGIDSAFDCEGRVLRADFSDLSVVSTYIPSGTSSPERLAIKLKFMDEFLLHCQRLRKSRRELVLSGVCA